MDEQLALTVGARVRAARIVTRPARPMVAGLSVVTSDYVRMPFSTVMS